MLLSQMSGETGLSEELLSTICHQAIVGEVVMGHIRHISAKLLLLLEEIGSACDADDKLFAQLSKEVDHFLGGALQ